MDSRSLLALLAAALAALLPPPAASSGHRKLLVFLLDGFRFDYIDDSELDGLPGFRHIVNMGVKVDYMTPDFPSLSYPNYYTLMTGVAGSLPAATSASLPLGLPGESTNRGYCMYIEHRNNWECMEDEYLEDEDAARGL